MSQPTWIGQLIGGRYRIDALLGRGGMSAVYRAHDPNLRRTVAVKLIHPHLAEDSEFVRRFEEEAAAVAQLRHPNIVQVYDFNHDGELYYMVLEFLPGETLHARLRRLAGEGGRLTLAETARIAAEVCDALDYAHRRNMVHRDIKPANVMIQPSDQAVLMDFGVAKIVGGQRHTATGAIVGTALYVSPEQVRGESAGPRSDLYSLGVTLFEMATGQPPFEADSTMSTMWMHVTQPVPDLRALRPGAPPEMAEVVLKAMAKDPAERYASAADMAGALRVVAARAASAEVEAALPAGATVIEAAPVRAVGATVIESAREAAPQTQTGRAAAPEPVRPARDQSASPAAKPARWRPALIGGGLLLLLGLGCVVAGGAYAFNQLLNRPPVTPAATAPSVADVRDTEAPAATQATVPTVVLPPTPTDAATPIPTVPPTATVPPGIAYVRINNITVEGDRYVVDYETFEYNEQLPGMHVHFFFNNVTPKNAGVPGSGPWYLYGGPRPFMEYKLSDRPASATQMCALVANGDHSVQLDSGNCLDLPA